MPPTFAIVSARLTDPRKMMLIAGLLAAMGVLAGYVEVQQRAERTLALRAGPPQTVALQDFVAARDIGSASEAAIWAEGALDRALVLTQRGANPPRHAIIAPLFDVSTAGSVRLPPEAPPPGTASTDPSLLSGYLIHITSERPTGPIEAETLGLAPLGPGAFGDVMRLNGAAADAGAFQLMADGAFTAQGLTLADDFVSVAPFVQGRDSALMNQDVSLSHRALYLCALVVMLVAVAVSLRAYRQREAVDIGYLPDYDIDDGADIGHHPVFDPLPSQRALQTAGAPPRTPLSERFKSRR